MNTKLIVSSTLYSQSFSLTSHKFSPRIVFTRNWIGKFIAQLTWAITLQARNLPLVKSRASFPSRSNKTAKRENFAPILPASSDLMFDSEQSVNYSRVACDTIRKSIESQASEWRTHSEGKCGVKLAQSVNNFFNYFAFIIVDSCQKFLTLFL
jgi:hypothetical protein